MWTAILLSCTLVVAAHPQPPPPATTTRGAEAERHRVVVVGAGVSGLSAAATLLDNGLDDVILLEGSDRVGGRVHTVQYGGVEVDEGAEFVHGQVRNAVYELVSPYDMLVSYKASLTPQSFLFTNTTGDQFNSSYVAGLVDRAYAILDFDHALEPNATVAGYFNSRLDELLESEKVDARLGEAVRHLTHLIHLSYNAPDNLTDLGGSSYSDYQENPGDLSLTWKTGGYRNIFDFITKKFPNASEELPVLNKTLLNKRVTLMSVREGEGVEVRCADGSSYLAQHAIVTPSLGVLKKHAHTMFQPPLPDKHLAAIQALGIGSVAKVFVLFPRRWWPKDVSILVPLFSQTELQHFKNNSVHGYWSAYSTGFHPVLRHERMLCLWFMGDPCRAVEALTKEQVLDGVQELLNHTFAKQFDIPRPESVFKSGWASNPLTLGSYSFHSVASDRLNLTNSDLAAPVADNLGRPVILFAGEATHPHYYSTVHGALETGRREARNILDYLKKRVPEGAEGA